MLKITNGIRTIEVTHGAYEGIYRYQGYKPVKNPVKNKVKVSREPIEQKVPEKTEDDLFLEEIVEKPISQWNKEEVKRYANLKGIDISGTKNAKEAKDRIKAAEAEAQTEKPQEPQE